MFQFKQVQSQQQPATNKITADNARVGIQQGSNVIAANQSDIVAKTM